MTTTTTNRADESQPLTRSVRGPRPSRLPARAVFAAMTGASMFCIGVALSHLIGPLTDLTQVIIWFALALLPASGALAARIYDRRSVAKRA